MTELIGKVAIKWLGHACFLITFSGGTKVVTDPFDPNFTGYRPVTVAATAVTVSHNHSDHDYLGSLKGNPKVIQGKAMQKVKQVTIRGIDSLHWKDPKDKQRGNNTIFMIEGDGIRIVHLGDLGRTLTEQQVKQIGRVDVLLIPVGGFFTIDAVDATKVVGQLKPKVVIPMHYGHPRCLLKKQLAGVEAFLKGKSNVMRLKSDTVELDPKRLPGRQTVYVPSYG
jgi:L-ascorbate metabolism protein UlaG (beta-lactamase superfamily)